MEVFKLGERLSDTATSLLSRILLIFFREDQFLDNGSRISL